MIGSIECIRNSPGVTFLFTNARVFVKLSIASCQHNEVTETLCTWIFILV